MLAYVAAKYNISGYAGRVWQDGAFSTLPFWWCIGPLDKYVRIVQRLFFCSYVLCNSLLLPLPLFGKFLCYFAAWIVSCRFVKSRFWGTGTAIWGRKTRKRKQFKWKIKLYNIIIRYTNEKKKQIIIVLTLKQLRIMEMNYVAPELEVLEVMVEKGFAMSEPSVVPPSMD